MMTSPSPYTPAVPCAQWAYALAAPEERLSPAEQVQLERHLASCAECAAVRDEYQRMDAQIRALPAPRPLSALPPALLDLPAREDAQCMPAMPHERTTSISGEQTRGTRATGVPRRPRAAGPLGALAAVAILGALIGGYYAVVTSHAPAGIRTSGGVIYYGPPVDPAGPRASIGTWRMVTLPPGAPDRAQQIAQAGAGSGQPTGGAQVYEQPAVAGLLYAVSPPAGTTQLRMWRSEDAGRTWHQLALPAAATALPADALMQVALDVRAPDTVLLWGYTFGSASSVRLYSLNRGATWHTLQMPLGSDAWNVTLPMADRGIWYLPAWIAAQPAIWSTRDHGVTWTSHAYPVTVPDRVPGQSYAWAGTLLNVDYAPSGGLLWAYQHTLWWSPDDGGTWRRMGNWGNQPCDAMVEGMIAGTANLGVLYCLFSNGPVDGSKPLDQRPIWRSDDRGQTWTAIPGGPAELPLPTDPSGGITSSTVLSDGSLLTVAPSRERPDELAFYTLKRGANVWHEASAPLPSPLGYCPPGQPDQSGPNAPAIEPECATPLEINVTAGPVTQGKASQLIYITHSADGAVTNPVYVATITWK